jgi:hypothetical protein
MEKVYRVDDNLDIMSDNEPYIDPSKLSMMARISLC